MTRAAVVLAALIAVAPAPAAEPPASHRPDAKAVRRHGPAYRYPQAGWIVLHVEGEPYERGFQHGTLLAPEIAAMVKSLANQRSTRAPADGWKHVRTLVSALFLRKFDREWLDEMKGIADGAAASGATFDNRPIDLLDVVTVNVWMEIDTLDSALDATPTGLEGVRFPGADRPAAPKPKAPAPRDHCSAFIATGPATADGKIVFGHITMSGLTSGPFVNVWIDVKPKAGRRFVMQSFPGGIWSAMDYYINDAGILLAETTLDQTRFDATGTPLTGRTRKAIQYGESIDDVVRHLSEGNNGLYTNEWLIGDTKTNEIALYELGTRQSRLRRSSKNDWLHGATGFYWGCNNTKDLQVRLEAFPGVEGRPANAVWKPSDRDVMWMKLYREHAGRIDADFGKKAFDTPPLCAAITLDAKVSTAALAAELASHARYGPPLGRVWHPTFEERTDHPDIRPLVPHPWTVLTTTPPPDSNGDAAVDLPERVDGAPMTLAERMPAEAEKNNPPAWHGTILPKTDADVWLAAGFAEFERVVALEKAIKKKLGDKLTDADREPVVVALYGHHSAWAAALAAAPKWRTEGGKAPSELDLELDRNRWVREQTGYGVLALHILRNLTGAEKFDDAMDAFGRANAGKAVTVEQFLAEVEKRTDTKVAELRKAFAPGPAFLTPFLTPFTTRSFLEEPESCLIVYGTLDDEAANRAAAYDLQARIRKHWSNVTVPVIADRDAKRDELAKRHLLLTGWPTANAVTMSVGEALPVSFTDRTFTVKEGTYAHPDSCVIMAGESPINPRYSVVVLAGLSGRATFHAAEFLMKKDVPAGEVLVCPANAPAKPVVLTVGK
jgi:hypothetical protein